MNDESSRCAAALDRQAIRFSQGEWRSSDRALHGLGEIVLRGDAFGRPAWSSARNHHGKVPITETAGRIALEFVDVSECAAIRGSSSGAVSPKALGLTANDSSWSGLGVRDNGPSCRNGQ